LLPIAILVTREILGEGESEWKRFRKATVTEMAYSVQTLIDGRHRKNKINPAIVDEWIKGIEIT
jgi:hypothetical protein